MLLHVLTACAKRWPIIIIAVACIAAAPGALAQSSVYKCVDAQGGIVYQQDPCTPNSTAGRLPPETTVPPLAQIRPNDRSIDQCLKLHDYTRNAPDFQLRTAAFVPVGDGSYQIALTGTVPGVGGAPAGRNTVRCPVTGDGSVNLDLWRTQKALANVQKPGSALTGTPPVERAIAATASGTGTSNTGAGNTATTNTGTTGTAAGAPGASATTSGADANRPRISNGERAAERRFIEGSILGGTLRMADVRERLGDPDNQGSASGECMAPTGPAATPCRFLTWVYEPSTLDPQTRTTIQFSDAGEAIRVTREIVR